MQEIEEKRIENSEKPTKKRGRKPGTPLSNTPSSARAQLVKSSDIRQAGCFLPMAPTCAEDIVEQWQVPSNDAYSVRVNIFKQALGSDSRELIAVQPMLEYDMGKIAGEFGPGRYYIKGTPSRYAMNSARFDIAPEYAAAHGYGRIPAKAQDVQAAMTLQKATQGPVEPVELLAAVERMIDSKMTQQVQVMPQQNPMASMEAQFEGMFKFMSMMDRIETRAMQLAEKRMGIRDAEPDVEPQKTSSLMEALLPTGLKILERFMSGQTPTTPQRPAIQSQPAAQPAPMTQEGTTMPAPINLPELSEEEKKIIAPTVKMLRPFSSILINSIKSAAPDEALARELGGFIPPNLYQSTIGLCDMVQRRGVEILGHIHPELVNPRWAPVLQIMGSELNQVLSQGEPE